MTTAMYLGHGHYLTLSAAVIAESFVLQFLLLEVVWLKRLCAGFSSQQFKGVYTGARLPRFSGPLLSGGKLRSRAIRRQSGILFFLNSDPQLPSRQSLVAVIHALWHSVSGRFYLVCSAPKQICRELRSRYAVGLPEKNVVIDEAGSIGQALKITELPQAVEFDDQGRIKRYGQPDLPKAVEDTDDQHGYASVVDGRDRPGETGCISYGPFMAVESDVFCVLTRFHLRSPLLLVPFYIRYRRIKKEARGLDGLILASFFVQDAHTCYTLSLWRDEGSLIEFGRIQSHIRAANLAFRATYDEARSRSEIWSGQFRLAATGRGNMAWDTLKPLISLATMREGSPVGKRL
jgi:hypothetical protein